MTTLTAVPCRNTRDLDMYGVADIEALAADVSRKLTQDRASMALLLVDMLSTAKETMALDTEQARQTLNRAQFLIHRCCPMLNPPATEEQHAA